MRVSRRVHCGTVIARLYASVGILVNVVSCAVFVVVSYGDALADILAKLDSLGDSGNGGSKNDDHGAAATNTQSAGVPSGGVAQ